MAKSKKLEQKTNSRGHLTSSRKLSSSSRCKKVRGKAHHKKLQVKASDKKAWDDAVCSVCLESPHNGILLLCFSHDKGCRPYMCATSHRYSNCLDQYKKAYMNYSEEDQSGCPNNGKSKNSELLCPLCRGEVKGWTVVEPARKYLNAKKRTCMHDECTFRGTYKEIKKHVKSEHPMARPPRDVDPTLVEKWKRLEYDRALRDVLSSIRSTTPGAIVIGDYVIERNNSYSNTGSLSGDYDENSDFFDNTFLGFGRPSGPHPSSPRDFERGYESLDGEYFGEWRASRRSGRYNVPRIARPHTRLLFARHAGRFRAGR